MAFGPNTAIALVGYGCLPLAWWLERRRQRHLPMLLLVLCAGLLRLSASLDPCLHEWDERYHALVAKHLIEHPLTPTLYDDPATPHVRGSWVLGHVWLHKPPLSLWAISCSLQFFGSESWAVRIPSIILSMVAVLLLFALARERWSGTAAFWAAMLFAINGHLVELASGRTSNDHPDTFLIVFVLASVFAASRMALRDSLRWAILSGMLLGGAYLSKSWPALIVVPVSACFLLSQTAIPQSRRLALLCTLLLAGAAVAAPWSIYAWVSFPEVAAAASDAQWRHFSVGLEGHARPWYYYIAQFPMLFGEGSPLALLWFVLVPLKRSWLQQLPLVVWVLLTYAMFSFAVTKMPAYVSIASPAIFIIVGIAVEHWSTWRSHSILRTTVIRVVLVALILLPIRFSIDRTAPFKEERVRYPPFTFAGTQDVVAMNHPFPIELMFHTDVKAAYDHALSDSTLSRLESLGYEVRDYR